MYQSRLVVDGETGHLITAVLLPGNGHGNRFVVLVLRRLLRQVRAVWPTVPVELRADSGFATPRLFAWCAAHGVAYTSGLIPNAVLERRAAPLLAAAAAQSAAAGGAKVRWPTRPLPGRGLAGPAAGGVPGRDPGQRPEHPLRGDHPSGRPPGAVRLVGRPRRGRELDQGLQERPGHRPTERSPLLGQRRPAPAARGGLLAAGPAPPLGARGPGRPAATRHLPPARHQDRRLGAGVHRLRHPPGLRPPQLSPPGARPLAPAGPCHTPAHLGPLNNPG